LRPGFCPGPAHNAPRPLSGLGERRARERMGGERRRRERKVREGKNPHCYGLGRYHRRITFVIAVISRMGSFLHAHLP